MKIRTGTYIKVTKHGIHKGRIGKILESHSVKNPITYKPEHFYTVKLISAKGEEIVIAHEAIEVYEDDYETSCHCGGDYLTIPHHYNWCPKGVGNVEDSKN